MTALAAWEGRIVVATPRGLGWGDQAGFRPVPTLADQPIGGVLANGEGQLWVAHGTRVTLLGRDGQPVQRVDTGTTGPGTREVVGMALDRSGALWLVQSGRGLYRHDASGSQLLTTRDGLANNVTSCVGLDDRDTVWIGTAGGRSFP